MYAAFGMVTYPIQFYELRGYNITITKKPCFWEEVGVWWESLKCSVSIPSSYTDKSITVFFINKSKKELKFNWQFCFLRSMFFKIRISNIKIFNDSFYEKNMNMETYFVEMPYHYMI